MCTAGFRAPDEEKPAKPRSIRRTPRTRRQRIADKLKKVSKDVSKEVSKDVDPTHSVSDGFADVKDPRAAWVDWVLSKGVMYILQCYRNNMSYRSATATYVHSTANPKKNRYYNVPCIDSNRVVLRGRPSDYIHASWVNSQDGKKYICAQAPLTTTIIDFWHMVLDEQCRTIVMLCKCIENKSVKCAPYYPTVIGGSVTFDHIKITLQKQTTSKLGNVVSFWTIKNKDSSVTVRHIHCTTWEDHSTPVNPAAAIEIINELQSNPQGHPSIIHCSAGVGRTCTLLGIIIHLENVRSGKGKSGVTLMKWLRDRRYGAIQKGIQFLFIHRVVLQLLCQEGVIKADDRRLVAFEDECKNLLVKQRTFLQQKAAKKDEGKPARVARAVTGIAAAAPARRAPGSAPTSTRQPPTGPAAAATGTTTAIPGPPLASDTATACPGPPLRVASTPPSTSTCSAITAVSEKNVKADLLPELDTQMDEYDEWDLPEEEFAKLEKSKSNLAMKSVKALKRAVGKHNAKEELESEYPDFL
ncbi:hypothetical protein Q1695_005833 [Nippostrongylus brasiliensis]|nr:hypothetical protein Q1695_005833 [Nippostrongylus brasiliensis]